ncbi:PP2C family protein-serine/threonine phosphatase [Nonomuraea candida]|uniref:PP2C family protein-serine/threonine phosphatase n=1 Tax=Nonomuraea candida TaxID=359159 RepID=UPI001FE1FE4B|nr:PP2C family protein-serine/threonine phosphatase [Nonomuraea candida]
MPKHDTVVRAGGEPSGLERMLIGLLEATHLATFEQVPALVDEHASLAGLDGVLIYLADLQQTVLRRLTGHGLDAGQDGSDDDHELRIDGTLAGRAFQECRILGNKNGQGNGDDAGPAEHWWVPVLDGTERIGVLRVGAAGDERDIGDAARHLASMVALMVVSTRAYSDSYPRLVRTRPMNVAAEMQWNLMPPLTCATPELVIGAVLEPAYEIGGDAFDYSIADGVAHLAVFDAMGHDVSAGLTANLAMAACRNHRRQGADLVTNSMMIERVLIEEFGRATRFVTAVLADLDLTTGVLSWVNRGHHPPVVIRGGRWSTTLECPPAHPLGLDLGLEPVLCREQLEPGDRVLLYTDGITEARNAGGREFGLHRFVDFVIRHNADGLPVPETLRRLVRSVLAYHDDRLQDDATVLLAEWRPDEKRRLGPL